MARDSFDLLQQFDNWQMMLKRHNDLMDRIDHLQESKIEKTIYKCDYCKCVSEKPGICEHCGAPVVFMGIIQRI